MNRKWIGRFLVVGSLCWVMSEATNPAWTYAQSDGQRRPGYDRPTGPALQTRSVVLARNGIVATSHPLAAQAGLDVLRSGGNAADAAIAANAMLGVVEPMSCGIGGDLFVIYWDNKTQSLYGLNASGRSPFALSREVLAERGLKNIPIHGPLSWSVPGCVSGWQTLLDRFGTRKLAELLEPAARTAESGFPVTEVIASFWRGAENTLRKHPGSAAIYLVDGRRAPRFGEVFRNPKLADVYRRIGREGAGDFYRGEIAAKIVAFSEAEGGFLSSRDLAEHRDDWVQPVSASYRGYEVWELPPSGQGIAVLQMLNLLEASDLAKFGSGCPEYLHRLVEAKKLAFADRARFYADPDFEDVPVDALISKAYARRQLQRLDPDRAAVDVPPGDPRMEHGDTVYLTVVDKDRNCCSLIQSVFHGFGSMMTPADLGFVMQNRGALFALDDKHPNRLEPHKRPFHTIIPGMVTREGRPWFCFGVMGGDMQPQGHVQVLVNLIDFRMNVQAAGDAARVCHVGSATPTGLPGDGGGTVQVESGIPDQTVAALRDKGHTVVRGRGSFGGYQGILIDEENGVLHGATESRTDGVALGY
jgi:gamma-glutamyltranspeptidase / glutathione hydrolase